jgi:hypothetical protein
VTVGDRIDELEMRRRQLLLRSERLRAELAADQRVVADTLSSVDRAVSTAKRLAPLLLAGGGILLFTLMRGRRSPRGAPRRMGFAMRSLALITLARRALTVFTLVRAVARSRRRHAESQP